MGRLFDRRSMERRCRRNRVDELELEPVVAALRAALREAPDALVEARHLAAMLDAAAPAIPLARTGDDTAASASAAAPARARRHAPRRARAVWAALVATVGVAVPSIAVAGALPGPVQHAASRAAAIVHLKVPDTTPSAKPPTPPRPTTHRPSGAATTAPGSASTVTTSKPASSVAPPTTSRGASPPNSGPHRVPIANPPHAQKPEKPAKPPKTSPPPHKKKNDHSHRHHPKKKKHRPGTKPPHAKDPKPKPAPPPFGPI